MTQKKKAWRVRNLPSLFIKAEKKEDQKEEKKKEEKKDSSVSEKVETASEEKKQVDYFKCPKCGEMLEKQKVVDMKYVCYKCGSYFRVKTKNRIKMVADAKSFEPWFEDLPVSNPLEFEGYEEKLEAAREKTGLKEAVTIGKAKVYGDEIVLGVCDARFMMSSMGHVVGEKITSAIERATKLRLPVFLFCCSGGARMQEGIISLMQMAKTSAAIKKHSEAGLLYVPVLTDPTTGGVTASFAMLGDIILAEPGALIGFAGPRVIKQTIGQELPKGFQTAEFLVEHGFVDRIVKREELKDTISYLVKMHRENREDLLKEEIAAFQPSEAMKEKMVKEVSKNAWQKVKASRQVTRPSALDYIGQVFTEFMEFHGDRGVRDDKAVVGGTAYLAGRPVTVIGIQKGKDSKECIERNFGMPSPEGYRKALRLMKQAEKFHRPIVTFVNTSGAFCGLEAEERGQGEAIARNLMEMSALTVPVLCILIGEGGSGGALALSVGNEVWIMENATYSILSPEGFASILWKDGKRAQEAAEIMHITAEDLKKLGAVEKIIPEFGGADQKTLSTISDFMRVNINEFLKKYDAMRPEEIAEERYQRFRKM